MTKPGYHLTPPPRGVFGELSKIAEELAEAQDAELQSKIMVLLELSDLYGAVKGYLQKHFPDFSMEDLAEMSEVTHRVFLNGHRTARPADV